MVSLPLPARRHRWLTPLLLMATVLLSGCLAPPRGITPVTPFVLERYLGTWHELARLDHRFERGLTRVSAQYVLRDDGAVTVINRGYRAAEGTWDEARGLARFQGERDTGSLKVSFFGPFYGGYHIARLDPDYQWSLVIGPSRDYFWILSRQQVIPEAAYQQLVAQAAELGIDTRQLIRIMPKAAEAP